MNAPLLTGRILPDLTQALPAVERRTHGRVDRDVLRRLFAEAWDDHAIAAHFGCCRITVLNHRLAMGLRRRKGRKSAVSLAPPHSAAPLPTSAPKQDQLSRHTPKSLDEHVARIPPVNHLALAERRTIYPATVGSAGEAAAGHGVGAGE